MITMQTNMGENSLKATMKNVQTEGYHYHISIIRMNYCIVFQDFKILQNYCTLLNSFTSTYINLRQFTVMLCVNNEYQINHVNILGF